MHFIHAILLGFVQGITEFFPISSSAHLFFIRHILGIPNSEQWLYFDLACHFGTWLALCFFLRKEIFETLSSIRAIFLFTIALTPLIPAYFFFKPLRQTLFLPQYTGYFLLVTAVLLWMSLKKPTRNAPLKYTDMLSIGLMQTLALLPGLSRSGSTMAAARMLGFSWENAARYSFLLAVPTILGGEMLESWKLFNSASSPAVPISFCFVGFATALATGFFAVQFAFRIYAKEQLKPFVWYCAGFGLLCIAVLHG